MGTRRLPRHVRIFLASPGDVIRERQAVREMVQRLERSPLIRKDFTIEVVSWDDPDAPVPMLATLTPQQAVSRALPRPSECELTVVIVSHRMGTPLDERKADGSRYRSGTEWEFEDARRADRPILLYRRTTAPFVPNIDPIEAAAQLRSVEEFFAQFTSASGALTGGITQYATVDELISRLKTDIESLLPSWRHENGDEDDRAPGTGCAARVQTTVRAWHIARLLLLLALGIAATFVTWTAFAAFSTAIEDYDAPALAFVARYALLSMGLVIPVVLLVLTWWWLGRRGKSTRLG